MIKSWLKLGWFIGVFYCINNYFQERVLPKTLWGEERRIEKIAEKKLITLEKNKEKQQICYKITFVLKCYKKKGYICKRNKHFTSDCSCNATYNELHLKAQEHCHIPESSETYLNTFYGKKIETGFKDLRTYALAQREKKRQFIYIFTASIFTEVRTATNEKRLWWWRNA